MWKGMSNYIQKMGSQFYQFCNLFPYFVIQIATGDGERKEEEKIDNCQLGHCWSKQNCSAN